MKTRLLAILIATFLISGAAIANEKFDINDKLNHMKMDLNLTQDQVNAIKPILERYQDDIEQAHKDKEERLKSILSSDQMAHLKKMKSKDHHHKK